MSSFFTPSRTPIDKALCALLLAASAGTTVAFQPLITEDTGTQGKGGNQLEFWVNEDRLKVAAVTVRTTALATAYTRGLSDTLDVFVSANQTRIRASVPGVDASGAGNPSLGAKWRFYENEESKTSFGLKPELRLPVSAGKEAAGLGSGRPSFGLVFIATKELPFGAIHGNIAASRERFHDIATNPDATTWRASIAPVWDVAEHWKLVLDVGSEETSAGGSKTRSNFFEFGALYSPDKDLDLSLGVVHRSDNASPSATTNSATAGLTWRFK